jgi:glucoside 3-dehydrogenase (cytochrome c) hitch-hiker subunit
VKRREAIKAAGALLGGALLTSSGVLAACRRDADPADAGALSLADQDLMVEIADTLLPTTAASPGAKAADVGPTINLILTDCFKPEEQRRVVDGLREFRATARSRRGAEFTALSRPDREALLREIDAEVLIASQPHYFALVRQLAEGAYFSSEIGKTNAMRYMMVPGRWVGCVPLEPGQPSWG